MQVGSLFSGIGGLDLGLERAGMHVVWQCEIDPYCRTVLARHWPGVKCYDDIRNIDESAERVDLICGGFPCQPVSLAGRGLAQEDPRWLWPEFARVVGLLRPRYVLVENVPGLVRRGLGDVVGDLYDAEWQVVSAAAVGAPHLRERLIVIAYPRGEQNGSAVADPGRARRREDAGSTHAHEGDQDGVAAQDDHLADGHGEGDRAGEVPAPLADADSLMFDWGRAFGEGRRPELADGGWWSVEPEVGRVAHGVPGRVAQLRTLGNAVVPQVGEFVGRLILEAEAKAEAARA